jgi:hypothetical protein
LGAAFLLAMVLCWVWPTPRPGTQPDLTSLAWFGPTKIRKAPLGWKTKRGYDICKWAWVDSNY